MRMALKIAQVAHQESSIDNASALYTAHLNLKSIRSCILQNKMDFHDQKINRVKIGNFTVTLSITSSEDQYPVSQSWLPKQIPFLILSNAQLH